MLHRLDTLTRKAAADGTPAADIYRRADLHRPPRRLPVARGLLHCPLCGRSAATFLPFGLRGRRQALCPTCGSLERHRFLWFHLARRTRLLRRTLRVLHAAPEPCLERRLRPLPNLRYRSVDLFDPAADVQADLCNLPFEAASIDLVISCHVLEHLPSDAPALGELARVVRPGGRALVMVPYDAERPVTEEGGHVASVRERLRRFGHPYHYRNYGADLPRRLAGNGFAVTTLHSKRVMPPSRRRLFRINDNYIFDCRRL